MYKESWWISGSGWLFPGGLLRVSQVKTYTCTHICIYAFLPETHSSKTYTCTPICIYAFFYLRPFQCTCICIWVFEESVSRKNAHIYVHVYVYIYIYIYIYIDVHEYIWGNMVDFKSWTAVLSFFLESVSGMMYCSVVQSVAGWCSLLQSVARSSRLSRSGWLFFQFFMRETLIVCCSVLQTVAVFCSLLYNHGGSHDLDGCSSSFPWEISCIVCCSVLQCVAVCCSLMQSFAACCSLLQSFAVSCTNTADF